MSSSSRNLQQPYEVKIRHLDSEALNKALDDEKENNSLKKWLIQRLNKKVENCVLVLDKKKGGGEELSDEELRSRLQSNEYECRVIETEDNPPFLVGYRFYRRRKNYSLTNNVTLVPIDTAVEAGRNQEEEKQITRLLDKAEKKSGESQTPTIQPAIRDSLCEFALHIRSKTSFWYRGFRGSRKEAELKRIADEIKQQDTLTQEDVKNYLLDIAHAAMHTRGTPRVSSEDKDIFLATDSGQAFMNEIFYSGYNGKFSHFRKYLNSVDVKTNNEMREKKTEDTRESKSTPKSYTLFKNMFTEAGLGMGKTKDCFGESEKIKPISIVDPANPYKRRGGRS